MPTDTESQSSGSQALAPAFCRPQVSPPQPLEIEGDLWCTMYYHGLKQPARRLQVSDFYARRWNRAMRIYNGMKFSEGEDRNKMADILAKYDQHFLGQTQEFFQPFQFDRRNQASGESIDQYLSVLRNMAKTCGFSDCMRDLLIMDRLLLGISDDKTREELLSTHDLTLNKAKIEICRGMEAASLHMKALKNEEINKIKDKPKKKKGEQGWRGGF